MKNLFRSSAVVVSTAALISSQLYLATGAAAAPPKRFVSVELSVAAEKSISDDVAVLVGASQLSATAPVTVDLATSEDVAFAAGADPDEALTTTTESVELDRASASALSDTLRSLSSPPVPPSEEAGPAVTAEEVSVATEDVALTRDTTHDRLIAEGTTLVATTYDSGIVSKELIETITTFDAAGKVVLTFAALDAEDYAEAAALDSATVDLDDSAQPSEGPRATLQTFSGSSSGGVQNLLHDSSRPTLATTVGLDYKGKSAVGTYARKYALKANPDYRRLKLDCTNFVSQALYAGGWKHDSGWYRSDGNWWYNRLNQSYTWGGAENWYKFARNESKRTTKIDPKKAVVGDIIQIKFAGNTKMNHSMVVTRRFQDAVYVSYHSNDTLDKPLNIVMSQYEGEKYYGHRV